MVRDTHRDATELAAIAAGRQIIGENVIGPVGIESFPECSAEIVGVRVCLLEVADYHFQIHGQYSKTPSVSVLVFSFVRY